MILSDTLTLADFSGTFFWLTGLCFIGSGSSLALARARATARGKMVRVGGRSSSESLEISITRKGCFRTRNEGKLVATLERISGRRGEGEQERMGGLPFSSGSIPPDAFRCERGDVWCEALRGDFFTGDIEQSESEDGRDVFLRLFLMGMAIFRWGGAWSKGSSERNRSSSSPKGTWEDDDADVVTREGFAGYSLECRTLTLLCELCCTRLRLVRDVLLAEDASCKCFGECMPDIGGRPGFGCWSLIALPVVVLDGFVVAKNDLRLVLGILLGLASFFLVKSRTTLSCTEGSGGGEP